MCISPLFIPEREHGLGLSSDKGSCLTGLVRLKDCDRKNYYWRNMSLGVYVPCGKCPECLAAKQKEWYARFELEKRYWQKKNCFQYFCTFTYNDENLPNSREKAVLDVQAFIKNLSRKFKFKPRFYVTSEFGSVHNRLHFHAIIFNVPYAYVKETFENIIIKSWHRGFISVAFAGGKEFNYISKYVTKDVTAYKSNWKPIQMFSKRPALGLPAGTDSALAKYLNSGDNTMLHVRGFTYAVPRYIRNKLISDEVRSRRLADFKVNRGIDNNISRARIINAVQTYEINKNRYEHKKKLNIQKYENLFKSSCSNAEKDNEI